MLAPGALLVAMSAGLLWSALHPRGTRSPPVFTFDDPRRHASSAPVLAVKPPAAPANPDAGATRAAAPVIAPPASAAGGTPILPAVAVPPATNIPGIEAADLLRALSRAGLTCSEGAIQRRGLTWTCSGEAARTSYSVQVHGDGTESIRTIVADVSQHTERPSEVRSAMFLGSLAALAYTDAEPQRAQQWVAENIMRAASMSVGPVRFELSGGPKTRTLLITVEAKP